MNQKGPLDELSEEEMAMVVPISDEEIDAAIKRGIRDRDLIEEATRHGTIAPKSIFYRQ